MAGPLNLSRLLLINAVATGAAGVVLFAWPNLIGGAVGIVLPRSAFFVYYLLAGLELGFAALAFWSRGITDVKALRVISCAFIVAHAASGVGGVVAYFEGVRSAVLWNVLLRVVMVALFLRFMPGESGTVKRSEG